MVEPHFKGSNGRVRLIKNILQIETYTTMVRKSKAAQSHIKNLGSKAQKQPKQPAVTMEVYRERKQHGSIKDTTAIVHYLLSCLQRYGRLKLICLHLCSGL